MYVFERLLFSSVFHVSLNARAWSVADTCTELKRNILCLIANSATMAMYGQEWKSGCGGSRARWGEATGLERCISMIRVQSINCHEQDLTQILRIYNYSSDLLQNGRNKSSEFTTKHMHYAPMHNRRESYNGITTTRRRWANLRTLWQVVSKFK